MPKVIYDGKEYECATAVKGPDYIRLLDANSCKIVSFEGIVDFTLFTIQNGSWTVQSDRTNAYLPKVMTDGSIHKSDISFAFATTTTLSIRTLKPEDFVTDESIPGYFYYIYELPDAVNLGTYLEPAFTSPLASVSGILDVANTMSFIRSNLAAVVPGVTESGKVKSFIMAFKTKPTDELTCAFQLTEPNCSWQL